MYVLLTRPKPEAEQLEAELKILDIDCFIESLISIEYIAASKQRVGQILAEPLQAVIITSLNSIKALAEMSANREILLVSVGEKTSEVARALGYNKIITAGGNGKALIDLIRNRFDPKGEAIFYPCGNYISVDMGLELVDFKVSKLELYKSIAATKLSEQLKYLIKARKLAKATFFSARTAKVFIELAKIAEILPDLKYIKAFALSKNIATILADVEWLEIKVAMQPLERAMIELMVE
jgi:uroporphyrinogen-III synthase